MTIVTTGMRVAMVMPPVTILQPADAVERWPSVSAVAEGLEAKGVAVEVHGRHSYRAGSVQVRGVSYRFHRSDAALVAAVQSGRPDVVHVHGLGWARLLRRMRTVHAPVLLQHHGEPVFRGRAKAGHRAVRRGIAGYLFTGASEGQAQPWIDAGVIVPDASLYEVLEAAAMLPDVHVVPEPLRGAPAVLWVGRLIPGKDPLTAVDGFAQAALTMRDAHLHFLATDRWLEPAVRARIAALGDVGERIHLHSSVPHQRIAAWYRGADVYLSTSQREAGNYSLIEAMASGCVPVVSDIPPHRAVTGRVGVRFPVGDADRLAMALTQATWRSREPSLERSRIVLSWEHIVDQLVDAYRNVRERRV